MKKTRNRSKLLVKSCSVFLTAVSLLFLLFRSWFLSLRSITENDPYAPADANAVAVSSFNNSKRDSPSRKEELCLTPTCFQQHGQRLAHRFAPHPLASWCTSLSLTAPSHQWQGLLLVKVPKAASSTMAGIVLRLSNHTNCAVQWEHREGRFYANRSQAHSFLLTSVRHPVARALSSVWFFILAPNHIEPTDKNIIASLHTKRGGRTKGKGGYQYNYLSLTEVAPHAVWHPKAPTQLQLAPSLFEQTIQSLLQSYNFIVVTERMEESLTAFSLLTGVSLEDIVWAADSKKTTTTTASQHNDYVLVRYGSKAGTCVQQRQWSSRNNLSQAVRDHFATPEWLLINYADYLLYAAANASLDRTIETLGRERFDAHLARFRHLRQQVMEQCGDRVTGTGCTTEGQPILPLEACYLRDFGCGYQCVDKVVLQLSTTKGTAWMETNE